MKLSRKRLIEMLEYDPQTGVFRWNKSQGSVRTGTVAGCTNRRGYVLIGIDGKLYLAQRLAVFYMTGRWPKIVTDHKDTNESNNRWRNIRRANKAENAANSRLASNNASGFKGVSWDAANQKWQAHIHVGGRTKRLGRFTSPEAASVAYVAAAKKYFGEFARAA